MISDISADSHSVFSPINSSEELALDALSSQRFMESKNDKMDKLSAGEEFQQGLPPSIDKRDLAKENNSNSVNTSIRHAVHAQLKAFNLLTISRKKKKFYRVPMVRQFWGDDQLDFETDWAELFFDLIFVAVAFKLGFLIENDIANKEPPYQLLLTFLGQFCPLFHAWITRMVFFSRFITKSAFHKVRDILEMMLIAFMALLITSSSQQLFNEAESQEATVHDNENVTEHMRYLEGEIGSELVFVHFNSLFWFSMCHAIYAVLYLLEYFEVHVLSPRNAAGDATRQKGIQNVAATMMKQYIVCLIFAIGAMISSAKGEIDLSLGLLVASYFFGMFSVGFFTFCFGTGQGPNGKRLPGVPMHVKFGIDRLGEFNMLMLGEGVLQIIITSISSAINEPHLIREHFLLFSLSFLNLACLQMVQYYLIPMEPEDHAFRKSKLSGLFVLGAAPISFGMLIFLGAGLKSILHDIKIFPEAESFPTQWLFLGSLTGTLFMLQLSSMVHVGLHDICYNFETKVWKVERMTLAFLQVSFPFILLAFAERDINIASLLVLGIFVIILSAVFALVDRAAFRPKKDIEESRREMELFETLTDSNSDTSQSVIDDQPIQVDFEPANARDGTPDPDTAFDPTLPLGQRIINLRHIATPEERRMCPNYEQVRQDIEMEKRKIGKMLEMMAEKTSMIAKKVNSTDVASCSLEDAGKLVWYADEMMALSNFIKSHMEKLTPQCNGMATPPENPEEPLPGPGPESSEDSSDD